MHRCLYAFAFAAAVGAQQEATPTESPRRLAAEEFAAAANEAIEEIVATSGRAGGPLRDGAARDSLVPRLVPVGAVGSDHDDEFVAVPPALGFDLSNGWFDPWPHAHFSRRGTPYVHMFRNEPAYLERDLFLDYAFKKGAEGTEIEVEAEMEYALTRRIGLVVEAPYVLLDPDEGNRENGFGDVAVAPRFLLAEYDGFLLSANTEFSFPTGRSSRGLGSGEATIGTTLSTWTDLGSDFTLQAGLGIEHGLRTDSDVLTWGGAATYSFHVGGMPERIRPGGLVRSHFPAGLCSLIAEIRGEHPLDGPTSGSGTAEIILGVAFSVTSHIELRGGVNFPAWSPSEFDHGFILGLIFHF